MSRIQELSNIIATNSRLVDEYLTKSGTPHPSFDYEAPTTLNFPGDIENARTEVLEASLELHELLLGAKELLHTHKTKQSISIHAIYHFKIAQCVPSGGETTFKEISMKCGLNEPDTRRILRYAMAHHIFNEPRKGVVVHTNLSRMLAEDEVMDAWLGSCVEEMWPAAVNTVPAMKRWPNSQEPTHTGFSVANNTTDSFYVEMAKDPARARRFALDMSASATEERYEIGELIGHPSWKSIGEGKVVDIGGSHGEVMAAVALRHPNLRFVVQDLPKTVESRQKLSPELESRIDFMGYDFFTVQPVKNADVYYFRWIFHNWSDKYCLRILSNLIPALKPKSRVIVNDACLPEPNVCRPMAEREIRHMDLTMLQIQNAKEREVDDWKALFHEADSRFKFQGAKQVATSNLAIIEFLWDP